MHYVPSRRAGFRKHDMGWDCYCSGRCDRPKLQRPRFPTTATLPMFRSSRDGRVANVRSYLRNQGSELILSSASCTSGSRENVDTVPYVWF